MIIQSITSAVIIVNIALILLSQNICSLVCWITCFIFLFNIKTFKADSHFFRVLYLLSGVSMGPLRLCPLIFTDIWYLIHPCCAMWFVLITNMQQRGWAEEEKMTTNKPTSCGSLSWCKPAFDKTKKPLQWGTKLGCIFKLLTCY